MADLVKFTDQSGLLEVPGIGKLLLKKGDGKNSVALLDPITEKILIDAGIALLSSLGSAIFEKIFGKSEEIDFQKILRSLINEIVDLLREVVDASDIRRATSLASAAAVLLTEYNRSPETVPGRLTDAMSKSTEAVEELGRILPASVSAYVFAVYTRLAALQQIAIEQKSEGEAENFRAFAKSSIPLLLDAQAQLVARNSTRLSSVGSRVEYDDPNHLKRGGGLPPIKRYISYYTLDHAEKSFEATRPTDALAAANEQHKIDAVKISNEFDFKIGLVLSKTLENFNSLAAWSVA